MIECHFEWRFRVNGKETLRHKMGNVIRNLATRLDGRISLAIDIQTTPPISQREKIHCIAFGLGKIKWAVSDSAKTAAEERILAEVMKVKP